MTISDFSIPEQLTSCRVLANANLNAIYASMVPGSGIGATLTNAGSPGALVIDTVTLDVGDRVAVYAQTNNAQNGIYDVIVVGDSSNRWVLERSPDFQVNSQMRPGLYFSISGGNDFGGEVVVVVEPVPAVVGVDPIFLQKVSVAGSGTAANKDATDNSLPDVASVSGAFVVNDIVIAADVLGTIKDSGIPIGSLVSPLTTKGDLFTYSTMNTRLPVGANGTILESDAAQTTGNGWTSSLKAADLSPSVAFQVRQLINASGGITADWQLGLLKDATAVNSVAWLLRTLIDSTNVLSVNWNLRHLVASDGTTVNLDWSNPAGPIIPGYLRSANNLSDVANALTSFNNISPLTTKGDLLSHDTTNNVRVAVGSNGAIVNADSTATPGVAWVTQLQDAALIRSVAYQARQLYTAANNLSLDWDAHTLINTTGQIVGNWQTQVLNDAAALLSINWNSRILENTSGNPSLNWETDVLNDLTGVLSQNWNSRHLLATDGTTVNIDYSSPSGAFVNGVQVTGVPTTGQVPTATSSTTATWQTNPSVINPGTINQAAVYATAGTTLSGSNIFLDASSVSSLNFFTRLLNDAAGAASISYDARHLLASDGTTINVDWSAPNEVTVNGDLGATTVTTTGNIHAGDSISATNNITAGSTITTPMLNQTGTATLTAVTINSGLTVASGNADIINTLNANSVHASSALSAGILNYPTIDGAAGYIMTTNGAGVLSLNSVSSTGALLAANNLSDVANALTSFNNISPLTTKGDLLSHSTTNNVRVPVGSDGTVVEANAANANGVEWTPTLKDAALVASVAYQARHLLANDGTTISIDYSSPTQTNFNTSTGQQFAVMAGPASTVNYVTVTGAASGGNPTIGVAGSDANITLNVACKGTDGINLRSANGILFSTVDPGSAITSWINLVPSASGAGPRFICFGSQTNSSINFTPAGTGLVTTTTGFAASESSNGKQGAVTLAAGTFVVSNTNITANSRIFLTAQDNNSIGALRVSARTPGTGFTITSTVVSDNGLVAYEIFEPN